MRIVVDKKRKFFGRRERGQSIMEFALIAPILILLFMGMFDFGWLLHQQIQMDNATRLGARRGAVGDSNSEILQAMTQNLTFDVNTEDITIEVRTPDGNIVDSDDRTPDNRISVQIQRSNVSLITPLAGMVENMTSINLNSEAEFMIE